MKICLITWEDRGTYDSPVENEDPKLLKFLRQQGLDVTLEMWSDDQVNWAGYDLGIVKSPWDYFDRIGEFRSWLDRVDQAGLRLLNPADIIRWNSDKHYLADIAAEGYTVVPTQFLEPGAAFELTHLLEESEQRQLVVKPAISGGSKNTFLVNAENATAITEKLRPLLEREAFLVQPFMPEIREEGEWSLIFFGGKFSHALLKRSKQGDFRVQHYLGGSIHPGTPPAQLLRAASGIVTRFAGGCLYARVDGIYSNEVFTLMELELIEPFLFLDSDADSYGNYYAALRSAL
jgi:glutathione synthase/RimK-type ligase-like ATP-grasp enzyme